MEHSDSSSIVTSIVIPCYNGVDVIGRQLRLLVKQVDPSTEILVVDNRSSDGTREMVETIAAELAAPIRVVDAFERQGINHARNVGVRASMGRNILICDSDDEVGEDWISLMRERLDQGAGCVGGPMVRILDDGTHIGTYRGVYSAFWPRTRMFVSTATGANCGFRRSVFDEVGGFDESFAAGSDEIDFFYRAALAGHQTIQVGGAQVHYVQRSRVRDVLRQHVAYGIGGAKLHQKFAPFGMPRDAWWVPSAVVATSLAALIVGPGKPARRIAVERLARRWGRLRGSIQLRHLYL